MEIECENCGTVWEPAFDSEPHLICGILRCPLCARKEDVAEEEVPEMKKVPFPYKKKAPAKAVSNSRSKSKNKYPDEIKPFLKREINNLTMKALVDYINKKWKCDITYMRLNAFLNYHNIKRKPLKKLPPEDSDEDLNGPDYVDDGE